MSDLKERFNNSPELHSPTPEAEELERDRKRAAETPTARETFLAAHPEFSDLQRSEVTGSNKMAILGKVRDFRVEHLKAGFGSQKHDLTEEEQKFMAEVLALRISRVGSVRALLDDVHIDAGQDFARAVVDARDLRAMKAKHQALKNRYPSAPDLDLTPETFVVRPL
jgi:hypothetical protein